MTPLQIWQLPLTGSQQTLQWAKTQLSQEELDKAQHFVRPQDQQRFCLCRAMVKSILAALTGSPAKSIHFHYGPFGKPYWHNVHFNISHSHDLGVLVVAPCQVGCDVEWRGQDIDIAAIADFFAPNEQAALAHLTPQERLYGFYRLWVRKEAVSKACGLGLRVGIENILASPSLLHSESKIQASATQASSAWWTPCFEISEQYTLAIAVPKDNAHCSVLWHKPFIPCSDAAL